MSFANLERPIDVSLTPLCLNLLDLPKLFCVYLETSSEEAFDSAEHAFSLIEDRFYSHYPVVELGTSYLIPHNSLNGLLPITYTFKAVQLVSGTDLVPALISALHKHRKFMNTAITVIHPFTPFSCLDESAGDDQNPFWGPPTNIPYISCARTPGRKLNQASFQPHGAKMGVNLPNVEEKG